MLNKILVPKRIPLPIPLNNRLKYYLRRLPTYFKLSTHVRWPQGSYYNACHFQAYFISPQLSNYLHISMPVHLHFCFTPGSLLIPPSRCLYSTIPSRWCRPHDLPSTAASSCSRLALLWRRHVLMLRSMLVHTTDALPNPQFQHSLAHCLSTIVASPFYYGPPSSLLDPFPTLAMHEQVYHTRTLTSRGFDAWLALLPSLATNCLYTIGLQPQPPLLPALKMILPIPSSFYEATAKAIKMAWAFGVLNIVGRTCKVPNWISPIWRCSVIAPPLICSRRGTSLSRWAIHRRDPTQASTNRNLSSYHPI